MKTPFPFQWNVRGNCYLILWVMIMFKKKKLAKQRTAKELTFKYVDEYDIKKIPVKKQKELSIHDYAKKFYDIMKKTEGYVDGLYLFDKFKKSNYDINNDGAFLWKIWRQVEHDYPHSINFIPQNSLFWRSRPRNVDNFRVQGQVPHAGRAFP